MATDDNRNVLLIVIDQLRADCVAGALQDDVDLKNLRSFQQDAVRFDQHFSVINPCGPSRCSLLTGKYGMNHRSVRNTTPLASGIPNLATESRKAGYLPSLFGYTDTGQDPRGRHPKDPDLGQEETRIEGIEERVEMRLGQSYPWRAYLRAQGYDVPAYERFYDPIPENPGQSPKPTDPPFYRADHSDTAFLANSFMDHIATRDDQNWFALLTFIRPHPPFVAPAPYNKMYDPDTLRPAAPKGQHHPFNDFAASHQAVEMNVRLCAVDDGDTQTLRSLYFGLATEVDHHIGRIIQLLKDMGQYDNTLIVVTADHGEMLGDHGLWGKQHIYDPAYKIPLIIRDPNNPAQHGSQVSALTESIDVTPTILDWIGVDRPDSMDGHTLAPFLKGQNPDIWRKAVLMELDYAYANPDALQHMGLRSDQANLAILRTERHKLVHFASGFKPVLFDLQNDPLEQTNLADDPTHTQTLLDMTQNLLSLRMQNMDKTLSRVD